MAPLSRFVAGSSGRLDVILFSMIEAGHIGIFSIKSKLCKTLFTVVSAP